MKRSCKSLILLGATTIAITAASALQIPTSINKYDIRENIQAYIKNPTNALDNIFIENKQVILPFIFENSAKTVTVDQIKNEFKKAGLTVKNITGASGTLIGTGTKITVEENPNVYNVLVYGDVNGNGVVDLIDAQRILLYQNDPVNRGLNGLYFKAANVSNQDNMVNLIDAQRILMFKNGTLPQMKLVVVEPQTARDTEKPVITLKGNATEKVAVGATSYNDAGATARDNFDGNLTAQVKVSGADKVNTKVVGQYTITYTVVDMHGNKQTATRIVNVVDEVKPVIKLNGKETITINVGEEFKDPGVTVTDNYDTNIASKLVIGGDKVNNQVAGEYKITYDVTDSSQNKAQTVTRTVVVKDSIISVEKASDPTKTNYNYGETELDLEGAELKINWKSNTSSNISVKEDMIIKDYDLTKVGEQTITAEYEGYKIEFKINVCDKIKQIDLVSQGRNNVSEVIDENMAVVGYKTNSKEDFVLGTLKAKQEENTSSLTAEQIKIEKQEILLENTVQDTANLNIYAELDENGNVVLKGKAAEPGNYTVNIWIEYGVEKVEMSRINLQVQKNSEIKTISLEEINDREIRKNRTETVKKQLTVKNEHEEELEVTAKNLTISVDDGINAVKLDADQNPITNEDVVVKYIELTTTRDTERWGWITLEVANTTANVDISFKTGDALVLTSMELGSKEVVLYTESNTNTIEKNNMIYTPITINFYNQEEEKMNIAAKDIAILSEGQDVNTYYEKEKQACIIMPFVTKNVQLSETIQIFDKESIGTNVILLDKNGNEASGGTYVEQIGIALYDQNLEILLNTLNAKKLKFECKNQQQVKELPIKVTYKEIKKLSIDESENENVTKEGENLIVDVNKEFTIGRVKVGAYEGPISLDNLKYRILPESAKNKINIYYEEDQYGNYLLKGKAIGEISECQISPYIADSSAVSDKNFFITAVGTPVITDIELDNPNVQRGNIRTITSIKAISEGNPSGEIIKYGDISIEEVDGIKIEYLNADEEAINPQNLAAEVHFLRFSTTLTEDTSREITIKLYANKGEENTYTFKKTLEIYEPVIRTIEIEKTANLYESANENTVTLNENGSETIYTLVKINAYADTENKKKVSIRPEILNKAERPDTSKVNINISTIKGEEIFIEGQPAIPNVDITPVKVEYFDKNKQKTTNNQNDVEYIGFTINKDPSKIFEKSKLNECEVSFNYNDNVLAKVEMKYTEISE